MRTTIHNYAPGIVLFALAIILSLFFYKDYGVAWDEFTQREIGEINYRFVTENDPALHTYENKDYGPGFELPLYYLEKLLKLEDTRDILLMRHLATHLFFLCACFAGYILAFHLFRNRVIASLGFLMFVFHPRLYAHSFFNSKDLPFLSMFLISLAVCQVAFDTKKWYWYLLAGIVTGFTTGLRVPGVILAGIICFFLLLDIGIALYARKKVGFEFIQLLIFAAGFSFALYVSFPRLWAAPVTGFIEMFHSFSHYQWEKPLLLHGVSVLSTQLPWYYLPLWFGITMPLVWLFGGLLAILLMAISFLKAPMRFLANTRERNFLIYAACFLLPVVSIIYLKSIIYDDWRHVYFIYAPFVLLVLYALHRLYQGIGKMIVLSLFAIQFAAILFFMIKSHPHEQVYFNELVSHQPESLRMNYELDYWGCSARQGLEYILAHDTSAKIKINSIITLTINNMRILRARDRDRIEFTGIENANYFLTNFRFHAGDYSYPEVFYEIKVANSTIMRVYNLH